MSNSPGLLLLLILIGSLLVLGVGIWIGFLIGFSRAMRKAAAQSQSKNRVAIGWLCVVSAIVFFVVALSSAVSTCFLLHSAVSTKGTVVQLLERHDKDGDITYAPEVSFNDSTGAVHTIHAHTFTYPPSHHVGDTVEVLYQSNGPNRGRINEFMEIWGLAVVLGGFAIVEFIVGVLLLRWPRIRERYKPVTDWVAKFQN